MSTTVSSPLIYSPSIQSLIPFLYVAWSDQVLSPSEIATVRERVANFSFLSHSDLRLLSRWVDPRQPPSPPLYQYWEIALHQAADLLPVESRRSLSDLGLAMAKNVAGQIPGYELVDWEAPEVLRDLEEAEMLLLKINLNTYYSIFDNHQEVPDGLTISLPREKKVREIAKTLYQPYESIRQATLNVLQDPLFRWDIIPVKEDYRTKVLEWCHLLAKQGFGAMAFEKEYGGEADMGKYAVIFETLGYHDLSLTIKFGVQFGLFGGAIAALGTSYHHDKYLKAAGALHLPGCFAMTETGHGSNVRGLETTATYDPVREEFVIHSPRYESGKEYIGNALHGRMAVVFAQLIVGEENHGVHALMVPLRDEKGATLNGIRVEDNGYKLGLNGIDNGRIWFDQVRVPRVNLLDRFGAVSAAGAYSSPIESPGRRFFTMLGTLVGGRVCVPRAGLSAAKSGLAIAIRYGLRRRQFAPNAQSPETILLDYQSHQRRLMPLLAKAYAIHFGLDYLLDRYLNRSEKDMQEIESLAAGMKSYATWFTTTSLQACREACGGKGYLAENRFAHLKAGTDIFTTFEGDNTVLMQLVAKGVMTKFRKAFSEDGSLGLLRHIGTMLGTAISQQNPISIRQTDREHLESKAWQQSAFDFREWKLTDSIARRIRAGIKSGLSAYDATMRCQTHMLALAEAYIERIVLEQFCVAVEKMPAGPAQDMLHRVRSLYALHTIEGHAAWFMENDFLAGAKSKAIRRTVDALCLETRKDARVLVAAFDIPDKLLHAPIAMVRPPIPTKGQPS